MDHLIFEGKVFSGEGNGKKYLALPWVRKQIEEKLGFTPYLGTLNLKLSKKDAIKRKLLKKTQADSIYPTEGYCIGLLYKAQINNNDAAVVIPQIKYYPENVLEIISPYSLREKLKLKDGDEVSVSVFL